MELKAIAERSALDTSLSATHRRYWRMQLEVIENLLTGK
jgi:hypothetical protein